MVIPSTHLVRKAIEGLALAADLVDDDDVHRLLHDEIDRVVRSVPFAPLAGRALRVGVDEQRHRPLVDGVFVCAKARAWDSTRWENGL